MEGAGSPSARYCSAGKDARSLARLGYKPRSAHAHSIVRRQSARPASDREIGDSSGDVGRR